MSSLVEDILGSGLRILLLGSYDPETKDILHQLRHDLDEAFQRYVCTSLLVENMDIHIAMVPELHDYSIFFEKEGREKGVVTIIKDKTKPLEKITYQSEDEFRKSLGDESGNIDFKRFRKVSELEKVSILNDWADLVYLVKHKELTRGGELVELTYLLHQHSGKSRYDPLKYEFFYQKEMEISQMVKEIVSNSKISPFGYDKYDELRDGAIETTKRHISRLNTLTSKFKQFE